MTANADNRRSGMESRDPPRAIETIRRAFEEFLTIPTAIIAGFLLLAIVSYMLDRSKLVGLQSLREFLRSHVFANPQATSDLLGAIASGIITMTSVTISLLLIAVQQSAGSMTSAVFDQFLRRRHNQIYFGFFIGLALYSLITLATVNEPFNPVFGGTLSFLGTVVALFLLLLLLYTSINQMRPVEIIEAIHDLTLLARERQLRFLQKTRRAPSVSTGIRLPIRADKHGFVTRINLDALEAAIDKTPGGAEVILSMPIGSYIAFQDVIAEVRAQTREEAERVGQTVQNAIRLERQRDLAIDPAYGIEELETIAWTSISTSKSNPAPGVLTILSLRDMLARWVTEDTETDQQPLSIVYTDNTFARLMDAFETLAIVSSESMQHQNYIEVLRTFTLMFGRLTAQQQPRAEDLILRILPALGDHVLTAELDAALSALVDTLKASERFDTAGAVQMAQAALGQSIGKLNSRSTRVEQ